MFSDAKVQVAAGILPPPWTATSGNSNLSPEIGLRSPSKHLQASCVPDSLGSRLACRWHEVGHTLQPKRGALCPKLMPGGVVRHEVARSAEPPSNQGTPGHKQTIRR